MSLRTLIVDDEPLARQGIRLLLREETDLEVVGECANGVEALEAVGQLRPALMFLDVQMPRMDGFALLAALPADQLPAVIFVTAYDRHALRAFEVSATDYLLKPIQPARFREAVQRARQRLQERDLDALNERLRVLLAEAGSQSGFPSHVSVKSGSKTVFVKVSDLEYVEAAANYVILHAGTQNHILRETLTKLESRLPPKNFLRIHRSMVVNLAFVAGVKPVVSGEHLVVLKSGRELPMTLGVREIQQRLEFL
jgi:two-component system LytT family response regulator